MATQIETPPAKRKKTSEGTSFFSQKKGPNASRYQSWNSEEVLAFIDLRAKHITKNRDKCKRLFRKLFGKEEVTGKDLDKLTDDVLLDPDSEEYDLDDRDVTTIMNLVKSLQKQQYMIYNDALYGLIELHPLLRKIMDTPEFQRLRSIKQLGAADLVYPGATHTRFDHSIGVCYLAGEVARTLSCKQPELNITDKDILCVEIAGLCHDLGHGPFSYMFELYLTPKLLGEDHQWKREMISSKVFDCIYEKLKTEFECYGLKEKDFDFIKEQIEGQDPAKEKMKGRQREKHFLYEIVANKRNGIDVDKWDYFARDCHYLGLTNSFQWRRAMLLLRAVQVKPETQQSSSADVEPVWQICTRDKAVWDVYNFFHTWHMLKRRAYSHKTKSIAERMIAEALYHVRDLPLIQVDGESQSLSQAVSKALHGKDSADMQGFLQLTDEIVYQILYTTSSPGDVQAKLCLKNSQDLLDRLHRRKLYKFTGLVSVTREDSRFHKKAEEEIAEEIAKEIQPSQDGDNIVHVERVEFLWGFERNKNPVDGVCFYSKEDPWTAAPVDTERVSPLVVPREFSEVEIRVYDKNSESDNHDPVRRAFLRWVDKNQQDFGAYQLDEQPDHDTPYISPFKRERSSSGTGSQTLAPTDLMWRMPN